MTTRIRKLLIFVTIAAVLFFTLVALVPLLVPVEMYQNRVIARIEQTTGRKLEIRGGIGLRLFPNVQLNLGDVHLHNPENFDGAREDMVALAELRLSLSFVDLLKGKVTISKLKLIKPLIHLEKNAQGQPNWKFMSQEMASASKAESASDEENNVLGKLSLPNLELIDGTVIYQETPQAEPISLNGLDLRVKMPALDEPLIIYADTKWNGRLAIKAETRMDNPAAWMEGQTVAYHVVLHADDDLLKITAEGKASPAAEDGTASPQIKGDMRLAVKSLKQLSAKFGKPVLQDASGEGKIGLRSMFNYQAEQASLIGTTLSLDDMAISGSGMLDFSGKRPKLAVSLSTEDVLVIDALLAQEKASVQHPNASEPKTVSTGSGWDEEPLLNNTAPLKAADVDLTLAIGGVEIRKLETGPLRLASTLTNGTLRIDVPEFAFYGGKAKASTVIETLDEHNLRLRKSTSLTGANLGRFLEDAYGFNRLAGKGDLIFNLTTQGASTADMIRGLTGNGNFALKNGAIRGFNLAEIVRDARTLVKSVKDKAITADMEAGGETAQTDFSSLTGSFAIAGGVASNSDLQLIAPLLTAAGKGMVNIPQKTVDYRLNPTIVGMIEGEGRTQAARGGLSVPMRVTGSFDQLRFAPDAQGIAEEVAKDPEGAYKNLEDNVRGLRDDVKSLFKGLQARRNPCLY